MCYLSGFRKTGKILTENAKSTALIHVQQTSLLFRANLQSKVNMQVALNFNQST